MNLLLANICLNPLDWLLAESGMRMVRYADDLVVLSRSATEAKQALDQIGEWMESAELTLHPEKTCVVDMGEAEAYWRAVCGRSARTVRREGRFKPMRRPYPYRFPRSDPAWRDRFHPVRGGWAEDGEE